MSTGLSPRLTRLSRLARLRLIWERYIPVFALPLAILGVYFAATFLGTWEVLGDPFRLIALILVLGLAGRAIWKSRRLRFPTRSDSLRRLEKTAGLPHRPLDVIEDSAVLSPDLWPTHVKDARQKTEFIRRVGRTPTLSPMDRYYLRFAIPAGVILCIALAPLFAVERLRHSLSASGLPFTNPGAVSFEAWVDPPDYTGRPPIYATDEASIRAPVGSELVVRASGASKLPRPLWRSELGSRFLTPKKLGENSLEVRTIVDATATLDWRIGLRSDELAIESIADEVPTIEVEDPPEADKRDRLVMVFSADDDYGVDRLMLEMVELSEDMNEEAPFTRGYLATDTETPPFQTAEARTIRLDLTRHPLAGKKVVGRLVAIDGAGQRGESNAVYFTVPDKIFVEPLAKAIVEQRALLVSGTTGETSDYTPPPKVKPDMDASDGTFDTYQTAWRLGRAPAPVQRASALIEAVTDEPAPNVFNDPVVYMGLRHVGKTLRYAKSSDSIVGLPDHMWKLALRAEYGVLGTALQEMQEAEAALREGIARRASQREIDTLFERYNLAVDAYMEELRRNAEVAEGGGGQGGQGPSMGSTDQIQELLDAIEEANRNGDTEGARQALAQLAELLENMQIQLTQGGGGGGSGDSSGGEMSDEMRESLEDLAETLGDQRELQDETRQAEREELNRALRGEDGSDPSVSPEELAQRQAEISEAIQGLQESLAGTLGEDGEQAGTQQGGSEEGAGGDELDEGVGRGGDQSARLDAGGAQGGLQDAEEAMRLSEEALRDGRLGDARDAQGEAIRALRQSGEALARQATNNREARGEGDPLGRSPDGFGSDNAEADIDERDDETRSREILEELRRRASEAEREQQEKDYLDRLLERF